MHHTADAKWAQILDNQDLITRCCKYLHYKRYPVPEGFDEALSMVQTKLYFSGALQRFDPKRHTDSMVSKRFEQYAFQRIEQILRNAYRRRRLEYKLFRGQGPRDMSEGTLQAYDTHVSGGSSWDTEHLPEEKSKRHRWPGVHDLHEFLGKHTEDVEETIRIKGYCEAFSSVLKTEQEKKIGQLMVLDYKPEDIAKILNVNRSRAHSTIHKIRQRARIKLGV